jgi:hypothetical protein
MPRGSLQTSPSTELYALFHSTNRSFDNYNIEEYLLADSSVRMNFINCAKYIVD